MEKIMNKKTIKKLLLTAMGIIAASALFAGGPAGPPRHEQRPEGGFSNKLTGVWDCGKYGTMRLAHRGNTVKGIYSFQKGEITGTVENYSFKGTWKQLANGKTGSFEFAASIERKSNRPTHLRGVWNYKGDNDWRGKWVCVRN